MSNHKEANARWRAKNPDYFKEWRKKNREKKRLLNLQWLRDNPDKMREARKRWEEANPEKKKLYRRKAESKRRAILRGLTEHFTLDELLGVYKEQDGLCYYCGCDISNGYDIEHKIPLSRGGFDTIDNICCSCGHCNSVKHIKTDEEFIEGKD